MRVLRSILRVGIALGLLVALLRDNPARLARVAAGGLGEFNYLGELRELRQQGRFGEALVVGEAGLRAHADGHDPATLAALSAEVPALGKARDEAWRSAAGAYRAAAGRSSSVEQLLGAFGADMAGAADARDLLVTAVASDRPGAAPPPPSADPDAAFAEALLHLSRRAVPTTRPAATGPATLPATASADLLVLARHLSPAGVVRLLRAVEGPGDLARLAAFVERHRDGGFALHAAGVDAVRFLRDGGDERALLRAAAGSASARVAFLRSPHARNLRPHPAAGVLPARWIERWLDPLGLFVIALAATWVAGEGMLLWRGRQRRWAGRASGP